ncbi:hypothetical protein [Pseudomonas sp. H3(2019)]|uniref:hypothetical protein n=1 Tax=Pseudomonas sp. H3(2019) TaxID=2598724 RepID=UPI0011905880|nr:hypothetical protein [Pseudomonas sp. H3(2019)]TVT83960.1 hypothetical protein FPT12_10120 [Pseudomonas sp. H3(2019)]
MLQISTGKFYETTAPEQMYETIHRGVFYTNYSFFNDRISTFVGDILPVARWEDFQTVACEVTERLPKPDRDPLPGDVISASGQSTMIQDFAALVSFSMNVTCTPDHNLARRLLSAQRPPLGVYALPRGYVSRMFDASIHYGGEDLDTLKLFIVELMGLERKRYSGVMRAVRRYVTAMHRMADDLDLAYALLVASIESLAQEFDEFTPQWSDLADQKRKPVDQALKDAPNEISDTVRAAILKSEHVALKRRFCEFTKHYLQSDFFRSTVCEGQSPAGRTDIEIALKNAYDIRSEYIHTLKPLPKNLVRVPTLGDILIVDSRPLLTFNGLARIARHVILSFTKQSQKIAKEKFDFTSEYPGTVIMQMAPQYWIGNPDGYSQHTARMFLNGFLSQVVDGMVEPPGHVTDMRLVMQRIRGLVPTLAKLDQKMPMLTLYVLFSYYLPSEEREEARSFLTPYWQCFDQPTIDSLVAHLVVHLFNGGDKPEWGLGKSEELLRSYISQRYHKDGLNAGPLLGAALTLWIAELHRSSGCETQARKLISYAVEEFPSQKSIQDFERGLTDEPIPEVNCKSILLPHLAIKTGESHGADVE